MNTPDQTVLFRDLPIASELVGALEERGILEAFPIQAATITDALAGRDVLGKARTGSGKTLAFGLPAITRLAEMDRPGPRQPHAIVLVPTRELAMQVHDSLEPYAHALHVSLKLVAGGLSMSKQIMSLERGVHLLIATPGRLADLARRGHADLSNVSLVVLDEADHMADMGFMEEITAILDQTKPGGQRLLFSATLDEDANHMVKNYMDNPVVHDVTDGEDERPEMRHIVLNVPPHAKYQLATRIANRQGRTIIFVRTKLAADRIADDLRHDGVLAVALHGDKSQADRNIAISQFRAAQIPVLVATDVAARGIHVDAVDLVLQIDPPADPKDYTHRAGRTARAGASGLVVTMVLPHQRRTVDRMLATAEIDPTFATIKDDERGFEKLAELTGATEPSFVAVQLPRSDRQAFGRGRGRNAGPSRGSDRRPRSVGGFDRGRYDRDDRPARGERFDRGERRFDRDDRYDRRPQRDEAQFNDRERAIVEREQALARKEAELRQRESQYRDQVSDFESKANARPEKRSYGRGGNDYNDRGNNRDFGKKPYKGQSGRGGFGGDQRPSRFRDDRDGAPNQRRYNDDAGAGRRGDARQDTGRSTERGGRYDREGQNSGRDERSQRFERPERSGSRNAGSTGGKKDKFAAPKRGGVKRAAAGSAPRKPRAKKKR